MSDRVIEIHANKAVAITAKRIEPNPRIYFDLQTGSQYVAWSMELEEADRMAEKLRYAVRIFQRDQEESHG